MSVASRLLGRLFGGKIMRPKLEELAEKMLNRNLITNEILLSELKTEGLDVDISGFSVDLSQIPNNKVPLVLSALMNSRAIAKGEEPEEFIARVVGVSIEEDLEEVAVRMPLDAIASRLLSS